MRRVTLLILVWLLVAICFSFSGIQAQAPATNNVVSDLERPILACERQIAGWRREEHTQIALIISVMVFGAIISALQKNRPAETDPKPSGVSWTKWTTIVLGIATTVITGITGIGSKVFTADYRTLRQTAFDGEALVNTLSVMAGQLKDGHLSQEDTVAVTGEYLQTLEKFHALGRKMYEPASASSAADAQKMDSGFSLLPPVYAQSATPAWVQNPPADKTSLYFVGQATDTSLSNAKQNSLNDAFHRAAVALKEQAPRASDADLLKIVQASAVVQDSTFRYAGGSYTYYTLLRVSREIQGIGIRSLPRR